MTLGRPPVDFTGWRFDRRVVMGKEAVLKNKHARWRVRCDCGREFTCLSQDLRRGGPCRDCRPSRNAPRPYRRKRPYEASYNIFVGRARHAVEISYEQFAQLAEQRECHYCGEPIVWQEWLSHKGEGGTGSNLDRCDSSLPYTVANVVVCCGRCNYAKNDHFTYAEWKELGLVIKKWRALANLQKEIEDSQ